MDLDSISLQVYTTKQTTLILNNLFLAYELQAPSVSFTATLSTTAENILGVAEDSVDFGMVSSGLTALQVLEYPNLQMFPVLSSAIVPIFRLDALGVNAQLTLSGAALAGIYSGAVTQWNHPLIRQTNPQFSLPNTSITVVYESESATANTVFTTALSKFSPAFSSVVKISSSPAWPLSQYYAAVGSTGVMGVSAAVVSHDGSIGYAPQSNAVLAGALIAQMLNSAGNVVSPTVESVTAAITAVSASTSGSFTSTAIMDYTDPPGGTSWPMSIVSSVLMDVVTARTTCTARAAVVDFWTWFYTSETVSGILSTGVQPLPPAALFNYGDAVKQMQTQVMCRGSTAVSTAVTSRVMSVSATSLTLAQLLSSAYASVSPDVDWSVQQNTDQLVLEQLVAAEADIGFFVVENVDPSLYAAAVASGDYLLLPAYLTAFSWVYNTEISAQPSLVIPSGSLSLDMRTMSMIYYSCILYWNDSHIAALNPAFPQLNASSNMIQQAVGCSSSALAAPLASALLDRIADYQASHPDDAELQSCLNNYPAQLYADYYACVSAPSVGVFYTANEATVPALVLGMVGGMGYEQVDGSNLLGLPTMAVTVNGQQVQVSPSVSTLSSCLQDAADPDTLSFDTTYTGGGLSMPCWPLTQQTVAMVRTTYTASVASSSAESCERGLSALSFLQWLLTSDDIASLVSATNTVRLSTVTADMTPRYVAALDGVLCDGKTMLITLPVIWSLSGGIYYVGVVIAALLSAGCVMAIIATVLMRSHPVIRSSSPAFLCTSLAGVVCLLLSAVMLVLPPTGAACNSAMWWLDIGFTLTFAPLFAKTWRIYRIFGRKKLSVVKISNRKLGAGVAALLAVELCFMAA